MNFRRTDNMKKPDYIAIQNCINHCFQFELTCQANSFSNSKFLIQVHIFRNQCFHKFLSVMIDSEFIPYIWIIRPRTRSSQTINFQNRDPGPGNVQ